VLWQKAKPAIWEGDRNPHGLELPSEGAERGNCPEAKPYREGLKGRRACIKRKLYRSAARCAGASPLLSTVSISRRGYKQIASSNGPRRFGTLDIDAKAEMGRRWRGG
jgi:hypothetical protein